jgi:hypothetical protein
MKIGVFKIPLGLAILTAAFASVVVVNPFLVEDGLTVTGEIESVPDDGTVIAYEELSPAEQTQFRRANSGKIVSGSDVFTTGEYVKLDGAYYTIQTGRMMSDTDRMNLWGFKALTVGSAVLFIGCLWPVLKKPFVLMNQIRPSIPESVWKGISVVVLVVWIAGTLHWAVSLSVSGVAVSEQPVSKADVEVDGRVLAVENASEETHNMTQYVIKSGRVTSTENLTRKFISSGYYSDGSLEVEFEEKQVVNELSKYDYLRSDGELYSTTEKSFTILDRPFFTGFHLAYLVVVLSLAIGVFISNGIVELMCEDPEKSES